LAILDRGDFLEDPTSSEADVGREGEAQCPSEVLLMLRRRGCCRPTMLPPDDAAGRPNFAARFLFGR
jgi:hypothetical protein